MKEMRFSTGPVTSIAKCLTCGEEFTGIAAFGDGIRHARAYNHKVECAKTKRFTYDNTIEENPDDTETS